MQYSPNSVEATQCLIRAAMTPAAQYRQAQLQLRQARQTFLEWELDKQAIALDTSILFEEMQQLHAAGDQLSLLQAKKKAIAAQRLQLRLEATRELEGDTLREITTCEAEIERIERDSGIDFSTLSDSEFQAQMAEEYRFKIARRMAAGTLAVNLGISVEGAIALLELPPEKRIGTFLEYQRVAVEVLGAVGFEVVKPNNQIEGIANAAE